MLDRSKVWRWSRSTWSQPVGMEDRKVTSVMCKGITQRQSPFKLLDSPESQVKIQVKYIYDTLLVYILYTRRSHAQSHVYQ